MKNTYQEFLKQKISLAPLGAGQGTEEARYFCTPRGASVIGWAGVDGIHYCFIRGFGEMVFAVSPMNGSDGCVHPLAKDFKDFLRLLLACKSADALEQAWQWDQAQFDAYVRETVSDAVQQGVLSAIKEKMQLSPMEEPWQYIKALQADFDYSKIKFTQDFYDLDMNLDAKPKIQEWKVYFEGSLFGHYGRDHAGTEIPVGRKFVWDGEEWLIPAVYFCGRGMIIDFVRKIPAGRIQHFIDKWHLDADSMYTDFNSEQQLLVALDSPLEYRFTPNVQLNGKELPVSMGVGDSWNPVLSETDHSEAEKVLQHYGLDPAFGWSIWRSHFPWKTKRRPRIKTLAVQLSAEKLAVPGPHFHTKAAGDTAVFTCPVSGTEHTLTVQEYTIEQIDRMREMDPVKEYPCCFTVIGYSIAPALPKGCLSIMDCSDGDKPRALQTVTGRSAAEAVSVIGGADGPTAVFLAKPGQGDFHYAISAPHFEPVWEVEWRMVFHKKRTEDICIDLTEELS